MGIEKEKKSVRIIPAGKKNSCASRNTQGERKKKKEARPDLLGAQ